MIDLNLIEGYIEYSWLSRTYYVHLNVCINKALWRIWTYLP